MDSAKSDWLELCDILALPSSLAQKWWSCLCKYYGDSVRHYHTMNHIFDMLNHLRKFKDKFQSSQEVSLAIFFHDIVYDPKAHDNENKSAEVFMMFVKECSNESVNFSRVGVHPARVYDMIIMTKHHKTEEHMSNDPNIFGEEDAHYFLDCDMAILGQERQVYEQYSAAIRKEYVHIDEALYCQKRKQVLQEILRSPKIFSTKYFFNLYEEAARTNIQAEIEILENVTTSRC